jgi:hypothetical protein
MFPTLASRSTAGTDGLSAVSVLGSVLDRLDGLWFVSLVVKFEKSRSKRERVYEIVALLKERAFGAKQELSRVVTSST